MKQYMYTFELATSNLFFPTFEVQAATNAAAWADIAAILKTHGIDCEAIKITATKIL